MWARECPNSTTNKRTVVTSPMSKPCQNPRSGCQCNCSQVTTPQTAAIMMTTAILFALTGVPKILIEIIVSLFSICTDSPNGECQLTQHVLQVQIVRNC